MKLVRLLLTLASIYAVAALITVFAMQTYFLADESFLVPQTGRDVALQVRGAVVYVSDLQFWMFKVGLYSSVVIILLLVFGTATKRWIDR